MFMLTCGDSMPFDMINEFGNIDYLSFGFILSYVIIAVWTVLQVTVAILLDKFVNASLQAEIEERAKRREATDSHNLLCSTMDPLLARLAKDYTSKADLILSLNGLFKLLDTDLSGSLSCYEFCTGLRKLDFTPAIYMSESDFSSITQNGLLCNETGCLGLEEFQVCSKEKCS